jgi:NAD kinase
MSDEWYQIFNDVFWLSISTGVLGFLAVVIKTALKSKCDETNLCWGLIRIHRRVELENDDNEAQNSPTPVSTNRV